MKQTKGGQEEDEQSKGGEAEDEQSKGTKEEDGTGARPMPCPRAPWPGVTWCETTLSSGTWKEAWQVKMARPRWMALTVRVAKLRPSRVRSTWYRMGTLASPGRRKYECSEWIWNDFSTVRFAAASAWPTTCPPAAAARRRESERESEGE